MQMKNPLKPEAAVIKAKKEETNDTTTYTLAFAGDGKQNEYSFQPGQFNMVTLFGIGEAPISLSSDLSKEDSFDHTVRAVGDVTNALAKLSEGDVIGVRGPYGSSWPVEEAKGKNLIIVSGGIGLAPLRPFITNVFENRSDYGKVQILYGARTPDDLLFTDEFESWADNEDTEFLLSVDKIPEGQEWSHNVGVVTTLFSKTEVEPKDTVALTCGPEIMMRFVVFEFISRGFTPDDIYISLERRMKCGVGMCGHCQIGPKYVCKDGPVFCYRSIKGSFGLTV
jgi:NAD(P)H-flavin reductase